MVTPNHLSVLGIIHTAISILALLAGLWALLRDGKIDPANSRGKIYTWLTVFTCLTALPIMRFGHLMPGHYLAIIILILLPLAIYSSRIFGKSAYYLRVIFMSTTLFLSFAPAINETLTRLPIGDPIAKGPNDPIVIKSLVILTVIYIAGVIYQVIKLRAQKKAA